MQCPEAVSQDHTILRRALDILDVIITALERGKPIEIADAETIVNFIKVFGIEYHQATEEEILFPALMRVTPLDNQMQQMVFQHEEHRALVMDIEEALRSGRGADFVLQSHRLIALWKTHLDGEERMLAQLAQPNLSTVEGTAAFKESEEYRDYTRLRSKYLNASESQTNTA